jgi:hypothetical protein
MKYDLYDALTEQDADKGNGSLVNNNPLFEDTLHHFLADEYGEYAGRFCRPLIEGEVIHIAPNSYLWLEEAMSY